MRTASKTIQGVKHEMGTNSHEIKNPFLQTRFPFAQQIYDTARLAEVGYDLLKIRYYLSLSKPMMENIRNKNFLTLIQHAYNNVEMYRTKWDAAGVNLAEIKSVADISKLPILTKDDLRANYPNKMLSSHIPLNKCWTIGTTGSTGSSVKVLFDKRKAMSELATMSPQLLSMVTGQKAGTMAYCVVVEEDSFESIAANLIKKEVGNFIHALVSEQEIIDFLNTRKPDTFVTYPNTLANVCLYAKKHNLYIHKPRTIMLGGEAVTNHIRNLVAEVISTQTIVASVYAATETGMIGAEMAGFQGLQVADWKIILESVDDSNQTLPNNELGNLLVTDLANYACPIIRYAGLGDLGRIDTTEARFLSRITQIEGRKADNLLATNGDSIHPFKITLLLQKISEIAKYQIRQEDKNSINIHVELKNTSSEVVSKFGVNGQYLSDTSCKIKEIMGNNMQISMTVVEKIPPKVGSHKTPIVVNLIGKI